MQIDKLTSSQNFQTTTKVKEKTQNADEFQANLNALKNEEKKENENKEEVLKNKDIDLSSVKENFTNYAMAKLREDQHKKNEATLLNKLFAMIDASRA